MQKEPLQPTTGRSYARLLKSHASLFSFDERKKLKRWYKQHFRHGFKPAQYPGDPIHFKLSVTEILLDEIGLGKTSVLAFLLYEMVAIDKVLTTKEIDEEFGTSVSMLIS